jgi:N-acetylneuraminic acid mutarotase
MLGLLTLILIQSWRPCEPMPTPGYAFACAAVGSRVYAIGGLVSEADSLVPRTATEAYDVPADSWVLDCAPPPGPRWYAGCAALDDKIYVIGGTDGLSDLRRVDRFDPSTNTWDTVAQLPWPRSSLAGCEYGGRIYAIGGYATPIGFQPSVARFTPDSGLGRWDVVDSLNTRRANAAAAVAGGWMCAVGGMYFSDLKSFEFSGGGWWTRSARYMNSARSGAAAVGWGEWLCAIGGQDKNGPLSSVEIVSMVNILEPWQYLAQMSVPRAFCGAAVVDTNVIIIGGRGEHGVEPSVEKGSALVFPGVEESQGQMQVPNVPTWPTVVYGRARIDCRSATIYDGSGRRVFAGSGPVDLSMAPGVYFARVSDADGRLTTGRITVTR